MTIGRRRFLIGAGAGAIAVAQGAPLLYREGNAAETFEISRTEAEWRKLLTPDQYAVLREDGTEIPGISPLLHEKRTGIFSCAGCQLELFSSATKYDSRTGWPSFWAPLEKAIGTKRDTSLGVVRTAVHCRRCGGHLGHVFNDGPKPTGLRYCMNGVAMSLKPAAGKSS